MTSGADLHAQQAAEKTFKAFLVAGGREAVKQTTSEQRKEIERYLRSGEYDSRFAAWPGNTLMAQERCGSDALKQALIDAVEERTAGQPIPRSVPVQDPAAFTRGKVESMVRGLFLAAEQEQVLAVLERSVVYLTPQTIRPALHDMTWLHSAWALANLYIGSFGVELLSEEAPQIVGMSMEMTCYVSLEYFGNTSRFSDYIVHETAHIFHNCKRRTVGLRETRWREWLLELEFRKREMFAYCCEAYSRILTLGSGAPERGRLVEALAEGAMPDDDGIDPAEYVDILREAAAARNGWKRILARCASAPGRHAPNRIQSSRAGVPVPTADARRALERRPI